MLRKIDSTNDGARGDQGPPGEAGLPGLPGEAGPQGQAGQAGGTGPRGPHGSHGSHGSQGPEGPQGVSGNKGAPGEPGTKGETGYAGIPGQSFTIDFVVDDVTLLTTYPTGWPFATPTTGQFALSGRTLYRFSQNEWGNPVNLGGAQGAPGVPGADGTPGDVGPQGADGVPGVLGVDADTAAVLAVKAEAEQGLLDFAAQADRMATETGLPKDLADLTALATALEGEMNSTMSTLQGLVTDLQARVDVLTPNSD